MSAIAQFENVSHWLSGASLGNTKDNFLFSYLANTRPTMTLNGMLENI